MNKPKLEQKIETINQTEDSITFSHYVRIVGTEEWQYTGTTTHYANGDIDLEDDEII